MILKSDIETVDRYLAKVNPLTSISYKWYYDNDGLGKSFEITVVNTKFRMTFWSTPDNRGLYYTSYNVYNTGFPDRHPVSLKDIHEVLGTIRLWLGEVNLFLRDRGEQQIIFPKLETIRIKAPLKARLWLALRNTDLRIANFFRVVLNWWKAQSILTKLISLVIPFIVASVPFFYSYIFSEKSVDIFIDAPGSSSKNIRVEISEINKVIYPDDHKVIRFVIPALAGGDSLSIKVTNEIIERDSTYKFSIESIPTTIVF